MTAATQAPRESLGEALARATAPGSEYLSSGGVRLLLDRHRHAPVGGAAAGTMHQPGLALGADYDRSIALLGGHG